MWSTKYDHRLPCTYYHHLLLHEQVHLWSSIRPADVETTHAGRLAYCVAALPRALLGIFKIKAMIDRGAMHSPEQLLDLSCKPSAEIKFYQDCLWPRYPYKPLNHCISETGMAFLCHPEFYEHSFWHPNHHCVLWLRHSITQYHAFGWSGFYAFQMAFLASFCDRHLILQICDQLVNLQKLEE